MINKELILDMIELKEKQDELKVVLKNRQEKFDENNKELKTKIMDLEIDLGNDEKELKEQGLDEYKETEKKQLSFGLSVRVGENIIFDDNEALEWAKEHSLCLQLNKIAFKKIAKSQDLDIVTKEEKVTICLPKEFKL